MSWSYVFLALTYRFYVYVYVNLKPISRWIYFRKHKKYLHFPLFLKIVMLVEILLHEECAYINSLRPRQDGRHFPDIFKCLFLNENVWILLKISLNFVPEVWINIIQPSVKIMAWCRPGAKSLSEPMIVNLLMHICVTRPQWRNMMVNDALAMQGVRASATRVLILPGIF